MSNSAHFIETATGETFRPLDPTEWNIWVEDIAHALSNICRFGGHCRTFYSVAEHSVRVANLLATWGVSEKVQLWGLLHDASEAYLGDIPTPIKNQPAFAAYKEAEERLQRQICLRFKLPLEEPKEVKKADRILLATEARDLMPYKLAHWVEQLEGTHPLYKRIYPLSATDAKTMFLSKFKELDGWNYLKP